MTSSHIALPAKALPLANPSICQWGFTRRELKSATPTDLISVAFSRSNKLKPLLQAQSNLFTYRCECIQRFDKCIQRFDISVDRVGPPHPVLAVFLVIGATFRHPRGSTIAMVICVV
jgi:hypothetical protein